MKIKYLSIILIIGIFSTAAIQISEECDATALKKELKRELRPDYKYDSSKTSRFTYKNKTQLKEIEVPLFAGEKYRFLFNTSGLPQDIKVEIYNKPKDHKKRKLLYSLEQKEGIYIYAYEPSKSRKMYINYTIPVSASSAATAEDAMRGCMIFVLGYKLAVLRSLD